MGFTLLEDSIEMEVVSSKRFSTNIHTLVNLRSSLINTLEASRTFLSATESFGQSSFLLSNDLNRVALQFPSVSSIASPVVQFNKEVASVLPQALKECRFLLDYTFENGIPFDHSEIFKSLKQEMDKFLVESNVQRKELRSLLLKYSKSVSDSTSDKIANTMAKLNQSMYQYEKYLMLIENELSEFVTRKHEFLFNISKQMINLHQVVRFGKSSSPNQEVKPINTTFSNNSSPTASPITTPTSSSLLLNQHHGGNIVVVPPQNFKDLLDMPIYLKAFRIFAEKQHCLENLLFWLDATTLKDLETNNYPRNRVRTLFLNMYGNYIANDCKYEINIDSDSKQLIENRKNTVEEDQPFFSSLVLAVENVYNILNLSMFPLFMTSPLYHSASTLIKNSSSSSSPISSSPLSLSSNFETCLTENRGVFHCINSVDSIIKNPITIEYFILFLKQLNPVSSSSSTTTTTTTTTTNNSSLTKSGSNTNISGLMSQLNIDNCNNNNNNSNSNNIIPPLVLSLSPRLEPLITPFLVNNNTPSEIVNMISFYLEINKFKDTQDDQLLEMYAMDIYDIYLKPGCEKQITTIQYQTIQDAISSKSVTRNMFKNVGQDILLHIAYNYFQPFLNSNICKEMLQREEKMKKYIDREEKKIKQDSKIDQQFELILKEKFKLVIPSYKTYILNNQNNNNQNNNSLNNNSNNNSNNYNTSSSLSNSGGSSSNSSSLNNNSNNTNTNNNNNSNTITSLSSSVGSNSSTGSNNISKLPSSNSSISLNNPYINSSLVSNSSSSNSTSKTSSPNLSSQSSLSPSTGVSERIKSGVIGMFSPSLGGLPIIGGITGSSSSSSNSNSSSSASPLSMSSQQGSNNSGQGCVSPRTSNDGNNNGGFTQQTTFFDSDPNDPFTIILTEPNWLDAFKKYVKVEKSEEILLFILETDSFVKSSKPRSLKVAYNIYETFIRDGSPLEVNIEYDIRAQCKQAVAKNNDDDIHEAFKSAGQSVLEMIRVGSYKNFLKSPIYKETFSQFGDPLKPKNKKK
ncbi:hypothetical protein ACTFIV_004933 [Dictyostelium citrinum]